MIKPNPGGCQGLSEHGRAEPRELRRDGPRLRSTSEQQPTYHITITGSPLMIK